MTLFETITERLRAIFRREPDPEEWLLPGNEVTRAVESGRQLAAYRESPVAAQAERKPRPSLDIDPFLADSLPPLPATPKRIIVSDDEVHAAPVPAAGKPLAPNEKPLEAKSTRKRWWRRAA